MSLHRGIARIICHHPRAIVLGLMALVAGSLAVIFTCIRFDSDVLNLLPRTSDSVRALKLFDQEFAQARELTFVLVDEDHATDLDAFATHFGTMLRGEPWVRRVMDRSPMETPEGVRELEQLALPLLLNLPPDAFDAAVQRLAPDEIRKRLQLLRGQMEAGSPKAEMELTFDPLGLVAPALKPLEGSFSVEQTRPLSSPDGTLRLVLVVTEQHGLDAYSCQAMMQKVADFESRVLASWKGPAPKMLVTGRTAYVGELSLGMRSDVVSTVLGSVVLVASVFYFGFRRFRPLFAIMHVLAICCLVSVALGGLIFRELNMITIGLCSILIGLGVDFGMLLYGCYQGQRNAGIEHEAAVAEALRRLGRGIVFGALTTAAAFLALLLSECRGFAQLGALIAIGILFAAACMMTAFFVFIGSKHTPREHDLLFELSCKYVEWVQKTPGRFLLVAGILLAALSVFAAAPLGRLRMEANPKSLEPPNSKAGIALRMITSKMPAARTEPVLVIVQGDDSQQFHDRWATLNENWGALLRKGKIKSLTSPAAFAISPRNVDANRTRLRQIDLSASRAGLAQVVEQEGFNREALRGAFRMLDELAASAQGDLARIDWRKILPESSSWWFVLERVLSTTPNVGAAYITPPGTIEDYSAKEQFRQLITVGNVPMHVSGWSYTIADLIPWSAKKLVELSAIMVVFNIVLLHFLYRDLWSLLVLMFSLLLSLGAMVACLKLFQIPLNLFNALAFTLVLGVGVDYGIYLLLGVRHSGSKPEALAAIVKPVLLSGLTTVAGFGSLGLAHNPSLSGLGVVCALGVALCLLGTLIFVLPAYLWKSQR
jgi:predicted RND superfamily exporter protein